MRLVFLKISGLINTVNADRILWGKPTYKNTRLSGRVFQLRKEYS
ncbi:MAG TPA: hypothetical protein VLC98_04830 [Phnomibacter sp.]|nr:hypothetical protein [Phnomibacter sp.]